MSIVPDPFSRCQISLAVVVVADVKGTAVINMIMELPAAVVAIPLSRMDIRRVDAVAAVAVMQRRTAVGAADRRKKRIAALQRDTREKQRCVLR